MIEIEKIESFVLDGSCEGCGEYNVKIRIGSILLCAECARRVLIELLNLAPDDV